MVRTHPRIKTGIKIFMTNMHMAPCMMLETGYGCIVLLYQKATAESFIGSGSAIHFEDRFCASKKVGIGGGGWVSARGASARNGAHKWQRSLIYARLCQKGDKCSSQCQPGLFLQPAVAAAMCICRQLSVGRSVHWSEGPDHCKLGNEWAWQR